MPQPQLEGNAHESRDPKCRGREAVELAICALLSCDRQVPNKLEPQGEAWSLFQRRGGAAGSGLRARGGLWPGAAPGGAGGRALTHRPRVGLGSARAAGAGCPARGAPLYSALTDGVSCSSRGQGWGAWSATLPYLVAFAPLRSAEAIHGAKGKGEDQPGGSQTM